MSVTDVWFIGQLGAAWLTGFSVGIVWKKFRDAVNSAAHLD